MVKAWGQRPPAISWETLQVELFHMAHQRVVLVEIMPVPLDASSMLLAWMVTAKRRQLVMGGRPPVPACSKG